MSVLTQGLGVAAAPHAIEHNGAVYTMSVMTQAHKAKWSEWLFDRGRKPVFAMRDGMTAEEYRDALAKLNGDWQEGAYDFESERSKRALETNTGMLSLLCILFGKVVQSPRGTLIDPAGPDVIVSLLVAREPDVLAMLNLVMRESFPEPPDPGENAGPNAPRAAASPTPPDSRPFWRPW